MKLPRCTFLVSVLKYFGQLSVRWLIPGKTRNSRTAMDRLRLGLVNWTNYTAKYTGVDAGIHACSYSKQLVLRSNLNHYRRLANNLTKYENIFFVRSLIRKTSWNFSNVARRQVFFFDWILCCAFNKQLFYYWRHTRVFKNKNKNHDIFSVLR